MGNHLHLMVGGQAVIEGVMMRGPKLTATAVRDPNGQIQVETKDVHSISDRYPHPQEAAAARLGIARGVTRHRHPLALVFGQDGR